MRTQYGYIYLTTNLINNKKYIGLHRNNKFNKLYLGSGRNLKNDLYIYGRKNFKVELLSIAYDEAELNNKEIQYIAEYNAVEDSMYYNIFTGGHYTARHLQETKDKISKGNRGKIRTTAMKEHMRKVKTGTTLPESTKEKMSKDRKGQKKTADHCRKIGLANKGKIVSPETRLRMRNAKLGQKFGPQKNPQPKNVQCPYCDVTGIRSNMNRWHFDNCKKKPI